jgi:hypothetical protein
MGMIDVRFVKKYTNHVGRVFRRYVVKGQPETLPWVVDICVRESRDGFYTLSNAEAKAEAQRRLENA